MNTDQEVASGRKTMRELNVFYEAGDKYDSTKRKSCKWKGKCKCVLTLFEKQNYWAECNPIYKEMRADSFSSLSL